MSRKMVGRDSAQLLCGQRQCFLVFPEAAQCINLCVDGDRRVRGPASLPATLIASSSRPKSLLVLLHFHQARAIQARVPNVRARIGDFGDGPRLDYIFLSCRNVA